MEREAFHTYSKCYLISNVYLVWIQYIIVLFRMLNINAGRSSTCKRIETNQTSILTYFWGPTKYQRLLKAWAFILVLCNCVPDWTKWKKHNFTTNHTILLKFIPKEEHVISHQTHAYTFKMISNFNPHRTESCLLERVYNNIIEKRNIIFVLELAKRSTDITKNWLLQELCYLSNAKKNETENKKTTFNNYINYQTWYWSYTHK